MFTFPYSGQGARICDTPGNDALVQDAEEEARLPLLGLDVSCLWPEPGGFGTHVDIDGWAGKEANELMTRAMDACPEMWNYSNLAVLIDPTGKVVGITSEYPEGPPIPADLEACILKAFEGLAFPCLGGYAICPEYVIAE